MSQTNTLSVSSGFGRYPYAADASLTDRDAFYSAVVGSLVTLEDSYLLKPKLLSSWHWDFKTNEYVLKINPKAKFHDGIKVTAEHVEFGIKRWAGIKSGSILAHYVQDIVGIENVNLEDLAKKGSVSGMKIVDDQTLRIKLKTKNTGFMYTLSYTAYAPVRAEHFEKDLITWKSIPVGAGDFKVEKVDKKAMKIYLKRVYHQGPGRLKNIIFNFGEDNWKSSDLIIWLDNYSLKKYKEYTLNLYSKTIDFGYMFDFNYNVKFTNELAFRTAINLCLDRVKIAAIHKDTIPMMTLLPSNFWGIEEKKNKQDLAKAKKLIESIKAVLPKRSIKIRMRNSISTSKRIKISKIIKDNFLSIGLETEFITTIPENSDVWDEKGHDLRLMGLGIGDILDPLAQYSLFLSNTPYADMLIPHDDFLEKSYQKATHSPSFDVRVEETKKIADYFQSKSYAIPIYGKRASIWIKEGVNLDLGAQRSSLLFYLDRVSFKQ